MHMQRKRVENINTTAIKKATKNMKNPPRSIKMQLNFIFLPDGAFWLCLACCLCGNAELFCGCFSFCSFELNALLVLLSIVCLSLH